MKRAPRHNGKTINMENIFDVCASTRRIFDRMLKASQIRGVGGSCLFASYLLRRSLVKFCSCEAMIRGGDGGLEEGILGVDGRWHGHYWVEFRDASRAVFIADITADQFGHADVVLLPLHSSTGLYRHGEQKIVEEVVGDLERDIASERQHDGALLMG